MTHGAETGAAPAQVADGTYVIRDLSALEEALCQPPLDGWEALLEADPSATLFQSPVWCLSWYQSYSGFEPRVLVVMRHGLLAGVVPLAVEISTGRLTFAVDNMADYRDVVARPEYRREVVGELLRYYKNGNFPSVLHFGSTLPDSETPSVLLSLAREFGVRTFSRSNYGWRWWPHEEKEDLLKKRSVRYKINCLRRQGTLEAQHVCTVEEWDRFKEDFYYQHSLRQLFAGRAVSFDNPSKRAFFDRLFHTRYAHVTALRWNGVLIAGHVGAVFHDVLYWGAPSFDIRYRQHSPNLVLLALTMKKTNVWGFTGIDLTIGKGNLKERVSTSRVDLPWIELYARRQQFYVRKARATVVRLGRGVVRRIGGEEAWEKRVKPSMQRLVSKLVRARELGVGGSLLRLSSTVVSAVCERRRGIVFVARPQDFIEVTPLIAPGEGCVYHDNELQDLVKRDCWNDAVAREIGESLPLFTDALRAGRTFHTVLVNDRLAGWGFSYLPEEPTKLTEMGGAPLEFGPNSASLYAFFTLPEFRGRKVYQSLLSYILKKRFTEGVARAYISVLERNVASRIAIERVGFRRVTINEMLRFLKWTKLKSRSYE